MILMAPAVRNIEKLQIFAEQSTKSENDTENEMSRELRFWGFETRELYKIALNFYKEKEGKAVHLSYEDKLKLVAFTQQVTHGKCTVENAPPLGVLDVIGRDRRLAWQNLGDISKQQAMEGFIVLLDKLCPLFGTVVEAQKRDIEEKLRLKREEEAKRLEEERRLKEADEVYAEQQYPGNPEQQGVLIRQLQEQHYHKYMQQLHQNQLMLDERSAEKEKNAVSDDEKKEDEKDASVTNENTPLNEDSDEQGEDWPPISAAEMWTRKGVEEFKETIRREAGDAVIKVGHGETATVRVPTHEDGFCLFWEFATDGYDIGFGVYFEWSKPDTNQVSVHISESEDEEDEEDEYESREDLESGVTNENVQPECKPSTPPISVIVPVYRRDSQEEIYAGSHRYPGQGVYLLKFDNSYSLWRSKTLYYRVYYTRPGYVKK
ncbi:hypothetical protein KM043_018089 [Ampulex compressa]|nr:hypothetical protein KM043_018089 [Ampulex compressa]